MRRLACSSALIALCAVACAPATAPSSRAQVARARAPRPPASPPAQRSASPPPAKPTPARSAEPTSSPAAKPVQDRSAKRAPIHEPGAIHCGKHTCRAGSETCCEYGNGDWCAKLPPGPDPLGLRTGRVYTHGLNVLDKACAPPPNTQAFRYATCDDSADCPSGQRCCTGYTPGGGELSWSVCVPIGSKKETCDSEPCRKGTCRGPLKHCSWWEGSRVCVARPAHMRCGKKKCSAKQWACEVSGKTQRCVAPGPGALPDDATLFECLRPKDCPKGTVCCESMAKGAWCTEFCDECMSGLACDTDANCPSPDCGVKHRRCVADPRAPGLKTCESP